MNDTKGHWRWNVNPTWEHYSSLCQEAQEAISARNDFLKYHHVKACLYFGVGALESYLNEAMRKLMNFHGVEEAEILNKLRKSYFKDKINKWPAELANKSIDIPSDVIDIIRNIGELRGEVTHAKGADHTIYKLLDNVNVLSIPIIIAEYIIRIVEAKGETFPYWLLGWNIIGMNNIDDWPSLDNNPQFMYSLRALGFNVPGFIADDMKRWEIENISSLSGFRKLSELLNKLDHCEYKNSRFPYKPRLCRKWWDKDHTIKCGIAP